MDWKPLLKTFVSVLFGFALGMTATSWSCRRPNGPFGHAGRGGPRGGSFAEHFAREFQLSADQQTKVQAIFDDQREKVEVLHQEVFPRFDKLRDETRAKVREVLTTDQQSQFDARNVEMDAMRKRMPGPGGGFGGPFGGPPPPDGGPPGGGPPPPDGMREGGPPDSPHDGPPGVPPHGRGPRDEGPPPI